MSTNFLTTKEASTKLGQTISGTSTYFVTKNDIAAYAEPSPLNKYSLNDYVIDNDVVKKTLVELPKYTVSITRNSTNGSVGFTSACGQSSVSLQVDPGTSVTVYAKANSGYNVGFWYRDGVLLSGTAGKTSMTDIIYSDCAYSVSFSLRTYTVHIYSDDDSMGLVRFSTTSTASSSASSTFSGTTEFTIVAVPNSGCKFVKWIDLYGNQVSTSATYTFTASSSEYYTAIFEREESLVTITLRSNDRTAGSVAHDGSTALPEVKYQINRGNLTIIQAKPAKGYLFSCWGLTPNTCSELTSDSETITAIADVTYYANFIGITTTPSFGKDTISVSVTTNNTYGSVSFSATSPGTVGRGIAQLVTSGTTVKVYATPTTGHKFTGWWIDTDIGYKFLNNTSNPYTFLATENITLQASFE